MATSGTGEKRFIQKPEERGEHLREILKGSWNCTPKRSKDSKPVPTRTQRANTQHSWLMKRSGEAKPKELISISERAQIDCVLESMLKGHMIASLNSYRTLRSTVAEWPHPSRPKDYWTSG